MGQVSSCISSGHAHAHNPPEYSQGLSALEAGRFTYADIYFQHAVEHHPGYSFWEELRAAAFAPPAAAMKEASAARAEPTSPVGADLFLSRSEKDSMAPPSEGGMLSSHSLTTGGRAESGGRHAMLEFSVSEAELRPKMDFLRLVADVAMAYTKVDYEERALYYWHLIAVCSHLLWQLIAHRERCGPMMAPPPPPPPPPPSTGEAGRRAWIHEVAKDERGTLMNPLHYSTRNIDSPYRDGFRTYVDASKEAKLEQLLTSLQQVLCRYCVSALMNYGVILCEQRVYFDAVLRQTVDAVDDGAASGGRPRRGTSKLNGLVIPTDVEMPSEWVEEKVRLVAYRGISATLPPLSTVARISALRRRHIRKMFQVFECTVVVMRQLLMMSCGHCDSVFNTQVKRWIEQATFVDGGSGGGATTNNNNNKNNVHDAGNDDDREENAVQLPRSPIGDGPLVEQASGSSLGSSNTQDSFGSSGLFEAGTDGGIAFILQPVTALPLSLVVNMEEVAKGNVSKSVSMAGELPSLHFAAHQPLGEDLPTVYVGHVADFVERMCQRTQIDYPTMMAARMQRQSKDIQQQQQQVSAERRLSYNVQEAAQAERRADEAAAAAVAQLNAEDDDAGEMAADGTARAQRSADDGAGGEKTAAERYVEYMSKTVGNLKREEDEFRATLLAYQRPSAAVLGKPTPSSSMSAHRDGGPVDPTMLHDGLCDEECVLLMMCLLFLRVKIYIRTDNPYQAFRTLTRIEQQTKEIYGENTVMAKLFLNRCQWLRARASRRAKTLRESKKHREAS